MKLPKFSYRLAVLGCALAVIAMAHAQDSAAKTDKDTSGKVSPPVLIYYPAPRIPDEARTQKINGGVVVNLQVGKDGLPSHVHVSHGLTPPLDACALEAVSKYRFKPATQDGKPTVVELNVVVNFAIN